MLPDQKADDMSATIPTHAPRSADHRVIQSEIIGNHIYAFTCETSWRGKHTFEASVTDAESGDTVVTETSSYRLAKRAYREYKRLYR